MIEIKELVIKAKVASEAPAGNETQTEERAGTQGIVNLCVAEVLKILKREKER